VILVDTGPLVAALAATDADHARCASFFNSFVGELLVTPYAVNEVCYLTERDMGSKAEAAFLRSLARGELLQVEIESDDLFRMAELVETHADFPLGMADASVIAVAERLSVRDIATLDHRHFRVVRVDTRQPSGSCPTDTTGGRRPLVPVRAGDSEWWPCAPADPDPVAALAAAWEKRPRIA
jgi:predicted nucleic acid-binding protein